MVNATLLRLDYWFNNLDIYFTSKGRGQKGFIPSMKCPNPRIASENSHMVKVTSKISDFVAIT
ncbi:hypothetical protein [Nostoc favosum]|uniref:hypothetical protein n=1 Tax=Nostoc favosum TaxID=2907819 RepID=UPI001E49D68D|nr:hypothetical protein [Nostoc favosum]